MPQPCTTGVVLASCDMMSGVDIVMVVVGVSVGLFVGVVGTDRLEVVGVIVGVGAK